jgi:hypothetical protein
MYCVTLSVLEIIPSPQQMVTLWGGGGVSMCVDTLADIGMLHFPNIYVQQTTVNAPHHSVDSSWFCC